MCKNETAYKTKRVYAYNNYIYSNKQTGTGTDVLASIRSACTCVCVDMTCMHTLFGSARLDTFMVWRKKRDFPARGNRTYLTMETDTYRLTGRGNLVPRKKVMTQAACAVVVGASQLSKGRSIY